MQNLTLNIKKTKNSPGFIGTAEEAREAGLPEEVILAAERYNLISSATKEIDALGDKLSISSSRTARYQKKENEAKAYIAEGRPKKPDPEAYPMMLTEAAAKDKDVSLLADAILKRAHIFNSIMALAESIRVRLPELSEEGVEAVNDAIEPLRMAIKSILKQG